MARTIVIHLLLVFLPVCMCNAQDDLYHSKNCKGCGGRMKKVSFGELLPDPGCEGTGGWADRQDSSATISYQQPNPHSGDYCIGFTGSFSERIESDPRSTILGGGERIEGSAWVRNTNGSSRVAIYINCYNGTTFVNRSIEVNSRSQEWTYLTTSVDSSSAATSASLLIYGVGNSGSGKHFDDVSLQSAYG